MGFDSKCNIFPPTACWGFSFALGHGVSFLVGSNILLSMVVQQRVVTLEFLQEKMSARPSTPPSYQGPAPENHTTDLNSFSVSLFGCF